MQNVSMRSMVLLNLLKIGPFVRKGPNVHTILCARCSSQARENTSEQDSSAVVEEEDELAKKMNVSRMPSHLRAKMLHVMTPPDPTIAHRPEHLKPQYRRKLYAKYGRASMVDPGIHWPSNDKMAEMIEDEKEWEPTLQERWDKLADEKEEVARKQREKEEKVTQMMGRMPKVIQEHKAKLAQALVEEEKYKAKQQAMLDAAREYYGYIVDKKDPRFRQFKAMKVEEEREARKVERKDKKAAGAASLKTKGAPKASKKIASVDATEEEEKEAAEA